MKKKLFSATAAGLMLLAGTGTASAVSLLNVGPNQLQGYLTITGFLPPITRGGTDTFTFDLINLSGVGGSATTVSVSNITAGPGTVNLADLTDPKFDPSPNVTDPKDPAFKPSKDTVGFQMSWSGSSVSVNGIGAPLTLQFGNSLPANINDTALNQIFTLAYSGGGSVNLMGTSFSPSNSSLQFKIKGVSNNSLSLEVTETCAASPANNICFEQALAALDAKGSPTNLGTINGILFVPEPASLALMGIGLAGLGIIRRKKAT